MKIAIAGLGYVGSVAAACLTQLGHRVVGVDVNAEKVAALQGGSAPVREPGLDEMVRTAIDTGVLQATTDLSEALWGADIICVCVGTPSQSTGAVSLELVAKLAQEIGRALRDNRLRESLPEGRLAVIVRSTMLPGSSSDVVVPSLCRGFGCDDLPPCLGYGVQPEFLREGTAVTDFMEPAKTVIGVAEPWVANRLMHAYRVIPGAKFTLAVEEAEFSKYLDNAFHALKVAFTNEMARIGLNAGVDPYQALQPFLADHKLNISERYLRPGAPFGGSCLPKDLRALVASAAARGVDAPLLDGILRSNSAHLDAQLKQILDCGPGRRVMLGLSFKSHTDDLRESPFVAMARRITAAGHQLVCHDATLARATLYGANRDAFDDLFSPGGPEWVDDPPSIANDDIVILCTPHPQHVSLLIASPADGPVVIDLTGRFLRARAQQDLVVDRDPYMARPAGPDATAGFSPELAIAPSAKSGSDGP